MNINEGNFKDFLFSFYTLIRKKDIDIDLIEK